MAITENMQIRTTDGNQPLAIIWLIYIAVCNLH